MATRLDGQCIFEQAQFVGREGFIGRARRDVKFANELTVINEERRMTA